MFKRVVTQGFEPLVGGGRNALLDWVSETFSNTPLPLGEGRISIRGTSIRNSGEGSSNTCHYKHCVAIQKKIDVKAGLLRKQGLLFTRNDELTSFNCVIILNNNFRKQVSVLEACFLS